MSQMGRKSPFAERPEADGLIGGTGMETPRSVMPGEVDVLGRDRPGRPPWSRLVGPVQVRVGDDLVWRRRPPFRVVLGRVGVADQGRVVPPDERSVERRADARIGLRAGDDEPPDAPRPDRTALEGGALEGVAVVLLDERLGVARSQLGDDPPLVAPPRKLLAGCWTQTTGTCSRRALSTRLAMLATTVSR